jgi:hypothetical protein
MAEAANEAYRRSTHLMNGAVMRENVVTNESTSGENISEEAIREALSHSLESAMFIQSDRLSWFIRFTVEATLADEADMLKAYLSARRYTTASLHIIAMLTRLFAARLVGSAAS